MIEIVKQLKAIVQEQNITQRELANRMNVTETSVSRWLDGSRILNAKNLEQMAVALGYRLMIEDKSNKLVMDKEIKTPEEKEADNVRNSYLAIKATQKQSCESYKDEDIVAAFQIGLLFGKADKAIEEVKKTVTPKQKMGHWLNDKCSECGNGIEDLISSSEWYRNEEPNFCPFCGIKMEKTEDDRR